MVNARPTDKAGGRGEVFRFIFSIELGQDEVVGDSVEYLDALQFYMQRQSDVNAKPSAKAVEFDVKWRRC